MMKVGTVRVVTEGGPIKKGQYPYGKMANIGPMYLPPGILSTSNVNYPLNFFTPYLRIMYLFPTKNM